MARVRASRFTRESVRGRSEQLARVAIEFCVTVSESNEVRDESEK